MKGSLQEKNGKYYAVFRVDKKQKWVNLNIPTTRGHKREAEQALNELLLRYTDNPHMLQKISLTDYINSWLDNVKNSVDTITYEGYSQYARKHIIPYFENLNLLLQDVKISDIEAYYNYKSTSGRLDGKKGGLSLRTIKLHGVVLNLVFKQAIHEGIIKDNPCVHAKYPTSNIQVKKTEPSFYTVQQCHRLLEVIKDMPLYSMVYVTFMYGLRRSEMLDLKWDAVDFKNNTINICRTVVLNKSVVRKDKTKNLSSKRTYPLLPEIKIMLEKMLEKQKEYKKIFGNCYNDSEYIFTKEGGLPYYPSYPTHELSKVLKKNNLPHIRWHDLRHSTASMLIEKGWHMKDISNWLGHADIGTTMNIYGHISMEHKRQLGDSLIGLLDN